MGDADNQRAAGLRHVTSLMDGPTSSVAGRIEAMVDPLIDDVRHGLRSLRKSTGFTVTAVLTLALAIGAATAVFSVVNGVLLNPLPYPHARQLTAMYEDEPGFTHGPISYLNFLDWQRMARSFVSMAIYRHQDFNLTDAASPERLSGMMVSADFFQTLGQSPLLGRRFTAADDHPGAAPVVMLSGGFWKRRFGASRLILGQSITLNGSPFIVVGVVPAGFTFYGPASDVYIPIGQWTDPSFRDRSIDMSTHAVGRLRPGVTVTAAQAEMVGVARNLALTYPIADKDVGVSVVPMQQDIIGNIRPFLLVLMAAVVFLLLIACSNVANLMLARSMARSTEFAIRAALGSSRQRIIRQLLTESLVLAGLGGGLGLGLAAWGTGLLLRFLPADLPRATDIHLDGSVLVFAAGVTLTAAVLFGVAPALKVSRVPLHQLLQASGRGASGTRHRLQRGLVAAEVALALVLLVAAGLMVRTLQALWKVNPGFNPDHVVTFALALPSTPTTTSAETRSGLRRFDAAVRDVPGVAAVSVTLGSRPMLHDTALPFWIAGQPKPLTEHDMSQAMCYMVEAGMRQAMGLTLLHGRFITPQDDERAPVVVVIDDDFARTYFPDRDPVGQRINIGAFGVRAEIVGVVGHVQQWRLDNDPRSAVEAQFYYPLMQTPEKLMPLVANAVAVVVRTNHRQDAVIRDIRRTVQSVEPGAVIYGEESMHDVVAASVSARQLTMILLSVFAALALALACIGIYGVVSYLTGQRTHEIGVRMALGAPAHDILRMTIGDGVRMALLGAGLGTVAALGLTHLIAAELFGVPTYDPLTFATVAAALISVAALACYAPARRAMKVDPLIALRAE